MQLSNEYFLPLIYVLDSLEVGKIHLENKSKGFPVLFKEVFFLEDVRLLTGILQDSTRVSQ